MNYAIGFVVALICASLSYINLCEPISQKIKILNKNKEDNDCAGVAVSKVLMYVLTGVVFLSSFAACLSILWNVREVLNIVKMNIALVCVVGAASMDYREHRIPNIYPLALAVSGVTCLLIGYLTNQVGAKSYIASSVIATIGVAVCLLLAMVLSRQGIGLGDIKLLSALALVGGVYTICGTIFFAMLMCAILSVLLLITKKKSMQSALPFGPFIYIGYLVTIFASIY